MTNDEFWYAPPILAKAYRKKHELEEDAKNTELWLQGVYFYNAVAVVVGNAMSKQKQEYPKKPFELHPKEEKIDVEKEREKAAAFFTNLKKNWDAKKVSK